MTGLNTSSLIHDLEVETSYTYKNPPTKVEKTMALHIYTHTHTELISSMDWSVTTHRLTGLSTNTSTERCKKLRTAKVFYTWSIETVNKSPCIILPCPSKSIATLTPHDCKCWELQWFRWIWKHAKNCQLLCLCLFNPPPFFPR